MEFETILVKKEEHIGTIILNRPKVLNALNLRMVHELVAALDDLAQDDEVRVVILTGAGRGFCSGADLKEYIPEFDEVGAKQGAEATRRGVRLAQTHTLGIQALEKPTIAMVNGVAIGAGFDLALACDMRVGSDNARFNAGFTRVGVISAKGAIWFLPRIIGLGRAAEVLFLDEFIEAEKAERIGLLNRLVPAEQLEKETMDMARKLVNTAPIALRIARLNLYSLLNMDLDTALQVTAISQTIPALTEDRREAVAALREKRKPVFKGR